MLHKRSFALTWVAIILVPCALMAGDFGALTKHIAKVTISRPPDAMLRGKTISIKSRQGAAFDDQRALELAVENGLSSEFTPAGNARPDITVTLAVMSYQRVATGVVNQTETRNVKVGTKTVKSIFGGKPVQVDDYQERNVNVQYWVAKGDLGLQVTAIDSTGTLLDSFAPNSHFERRIEVSVNGVATGKESIPSAPELQTAMLQSVASAIQRRYAKTNETVDVRLAVDKELRPGNVLAMSGQWKEALEKWSNVQMKKNPGDKLYNMAVAYEALAYAAFDASRNPDDAEPGFQAALKNYQDAMNTDPGEKYFRQAADHCNQIKANFTRAKEQWAAQQREAELLMAKAEQEKARREQEQEKREALRPDSKDEADFRVFVRAILAKQPQSPSEDFISEQESSGQRMFRLSEAQAKRVVSQELEKRERHQTSLEMYRDTFSQFIAKDKTIRPEDRAALKNIAERLSLSTADVRAVESEFQFKDLSITERPPKARTTSPANVPKKANSIKQTGPTPSPAKTPASIVPQ